MSIRVNHSKKNKEKKERMKGLSSFHITAFTGKELICSNNHTYM